MSTETLELTLNIIIFVFVFLFGICIGSFLNVCIYRLPKGESLVKSNSHCMTCGTEIKRYDLIPVFSWLILRGKCRACGAKITPRYMIIELMTGLFFLGAFARYHIEDFGLYPVMLSLFIAGLIVLCFQDLDNREMVVSVLVYTFIIALLTQAGAYASAHGAPFTLILPESGIKDGIFGMLSVSMILLILGFVITPLFYNAFVDEDRKELRALRKQLKTASGASEQKKLTDKIASLEPKIKGKSPVFGFGMGDIILMAAGGLMLGLKATITAGFIAVILAAAYGVYKKTVDDDNAFAFGPFLCIGHATAAFINGTLVTLYLQMLQPA